MVQRGYRGSKKGDRHRSKAEPVPVPVLAVADAAKAKELIEKAEANCLISNSMKAYITLVPTIR